jgi:hypothetical protein
MTESEVLDTIRRCIALSSECRRINEVRATHVESAELAILYVRIAIDQLRTVKGQALDGGLYGLHGVATECVEKLEQAIEKENPADAPTQA